MLPSTSLKMAAVPQSAFCGSCTNSTPCALHLARGRLHVVGHERDVHEAADHRVLAGSGEQHQPGVGARDAQLDPALRAVERAVGDHLESEPASCRTPRALSWSRTGTLTNLMPLIMPASCVAASLPAPGAPAQARASVYYGICCYIASRLHRRYADAGSGRARSPAVGVPRVPVSLAPHPRGRRAGRAGGARRHRGVHGAVEARRAGCDRVAGEAEAHRGGARSITAVPVYSVLRPWRRQSTHV